MITIKTLTKGLWLVAINSLVLFLLNTTIVYAQNSPYQAVRLNNGNPIIEPSMFSNSADGDNINGPSLIRVPDWIPSNERAHPTAQYYLYFANHVGDYIRMAWAANIEGPYTLYDDYTTPGNRGVLDNNEADIFLDNNIRIEENHLASPDVIVDDANQRIILYFHSGSSFFVNGAEQNDQVSWVSTSPYGLEFYDGIESVHLGSSYFRVFEYNGDLFALDNGAKTNKALDGANPWAIPPGHDFTSQLWDRAANNGFSDDIPVPTGDLRIRHTGVRVVGNQLHAFYSRRGDLQERIQLSTVDMTTNWESWDPTYPPIEILAPNPGWEGGERTLANSETSAGIDVNQLRDPDVFEDADGQLYLIYTGNGEGGLGIAKLYETPTFDTTLTTIADTYAKESSSSTFGTLNNLTASSGSSSSARRTMYMRFDLTGVTDIEHAVVRLYANTTNSGTSVLDAGGPITAYETSNSWYENTLNNSNAPALGDPITTIYLTDANQYYDWNITEYAKANIGSEITVAFHIAPSNSLSFKFDSVDMVGGNPGQLLLTTASDADPTIECLESISQTADTGVDGAIVTYIAPVGTDNLPGVTTVQTAGLASGSLFPIGTTTNTFVVTDTSGNTVSCSFTVTITDDEDPTIECADPISQTTDAGADGAIVTYTTPIGTDNATGVTTAQTEGITSGSLFPVGTTTNTFVATDSSGNTATCSFTVTITDDEDPTIVCLEPISQTTDAGSDSAIVTYTAPTGTDNATGVTTTQTEGLASGLLFPIGTTTNTFVATDASGNTASCSFTVTITDDEDPAIVCLAPINQSTNAGADVATVLYTTPVGTDNAIGVTTTQTEGLVSGDLFPIGTTTNTFVATDASGNTASCSFTVTVTDDEDPSISCPGPITLNLETVENGAIITYTAPVGTDNVTGVNTTQTEGLASGALFPIGTTTNTFVATDASGNTTSCSFTVTIAIIDNENPTISCSANITQSNDSGQSGAIVNYTTPLGTDNLPGVTTVQTAGLASGDLFPIGNTTNTFLATDAFGNTASCSFTVTVTDDEDPAISCPTNISQSNDNGQSGAVVTFATPIGTDNSTVANTVQTTGFASGLLFPIGTTTNTFIVTDASGNTATCSFTVTVTDDEAPNIICPNAISQTVSAGVNGAIVTFTAPIGTDNASGVTTVQTAGLASGSLFPIGATINSFLATDASGNPATCSFTVTITEEVDTCNVLIDENNFNSSWGIWNDGGADCRRSSNDASFANGGSGRCVRLRDNTSTSVATTDALDLSTFSEITVDFNFIADGMENGEDFWLQTSTDGGSSFQTVGDWDANDEFVNGIRYFESVTIQGPFPSNTYLRFRADASANQDLIYIDDVKITGCSSTSFKNSTTKAVVNAVSESSTLELTAYPNPFTDNFIVQIPNYDGQSAVVVELFSLTGANLVSKEAYNQSVIEITDTLSLPIGVYVLRVSYNNGKRIMKKMIKTD